MAVAARPEPRPHKPFLSASGERLDNFTRVEIVRKSAANGHIEVHWLKVTVDVCSRDAFSYEPLMVPGNRTAVPSPSR